MRLGKHFSFIFFFVFLCIAPVLVFAQDDGTEIISRLIDLPNIEGDGAKLPMTEAIRKGLGEAGHLVFSEEEMNEAARNLGKPEGYWNSNETIKEVNKKVRHDAVVIIKEEATKKKASLVITVINAYTGEQIQEVERAIKKKGKVQKADVTAIVNAVTKFVAGINASDYPMEIEFKITSAPSGATITNSNGEIIGKTPYTYVTTEKPNVTEKWTLTYFERDPQTLTVSYNSSDKYHIVFPEPVAKGPEKPEKLANGFGRPIFLGVITGTPTIRKLSLGGELNYGPAADDLVDYSHQQKVYPIIGLNIEFFPFPLFSTVDYLQGLGIRAGFGFGFGKMRMQFGDPKDNNTVERNDISCKSLGDGVYQCNTNDLRVNADILYRLMLQKTEDGMLNPNGMSLEFFVGFNMIRYSFDNNPTYVGHDYYGLHFGLGYSTALGLEKLRLDLNGAFLYNLGMEAASKRQYLGESRDKSLGGQINLLIKYDIWKGIFAQVGYGLDIIKSDYKGAGCTHMTGDTCDAPRNLSTTDMYHRIQIGFGYTYY